MGDGADAILAQEDAPGSSNETQHVSEQKPEATDGQTDVIYLESRGSPTEPPTEAASDDERKRPTGESEFEDVPSDACVVVIRTPTGFFARAVGEILGKK